MMWQYMLCMGLNPEEWNEQAEFFCDQGRAPGKASQQSGENVWKVSSRPPPCTLEGAL